MLGFLGCHNSVRNVGKMHVLVSIFDVLSFAVMFFFLEGLIPLFKRRINQVLVCFGISYVEIDHVQGYGCS